MHGTPPSQRIIILFVAGFRYKLYVKLTGFLSSNPETGPPPFEDWFKQAC